MLPVRFLTTIYTGQEAHLKVPNQLLTHGSPQLGSGTAMPHSLAREAWPGRGSNKS